MSGADLIRAERERQINVKGWTPDHDDTHDDESLVSAAACFMEAASECEHNLGDVVWPWDGGGPFRGSPFKAKPLEERLRLYAKAGACIAAEMDRLLRAQEKGSAA